MWERRTLFGTVFGRHHLAFIYQWLVYNVVPYEEWEGGISIDRHSAGCAYAQS